MVVAALVLLPVAAQAQFQAGDKELTLSGQADNGPDFNGFRAGGSAQIGYFFTKEFEVSLQQTVNYDDIGVQGSNLSFSTGFAVDYHFDLGRMQPYIGANLGYQYGDVNNTFQAGPEAGIKYFVNSTTFIKAGIEYEFFFDNDSDASDAFSDGRFIYQLGIGFRWH
jgi:hypothetical protein